MSTRRIQLKKLGLTARTWLVPSLMIVIACIHMNQWHQKKRSSWGTGAGFGMFATVDYHGSRFFRCIAESNVGEIRMDIPDQFRRESSLIARALPTKKNLDTLLSELLKLEWYSQTNEEGYRGAVAKQGDFQSDPIILYKVRLEVWGMQMAAHQKKLTSYKINQTHWTHGNPGNLDHVAAH